MHATMFNHWDFFNPGFWIRVLLFLVGLVIGAFLLGRYAF